MRIDCLNCSLLYSCTGAGAPKPSPGGEGAPSAHTGGGRGTAKPEVQEEASTDAKTKHFRPHSSSVAFGDSFPPGEAMGAPAPEQRSDKLQFEHLYYKKYPWLSPRVLLFWIQICTGCRSGEPSGRAAAITAQTEHALPVAASPLTCRRAPWPGRDDRPRPGTPAAARGPRCRRSRRRPCR